MAVPTNINLATGQFGKKIVDGFHHKSFIGSRYSDEFDFAGEKGITLLSTITQPLQKYGLSDDLADVVDGKVSVTRFGKLNEVEDEKQDLIMGSSKSFQMTLERQNRDDQKMLKSATKYLSDQMNEVVTPYFDRYALHRWANWDNTGAPGPGITVKSDVALDKSNVVEAILDAETAMFNAGIPDGDRFLYVPASVYAKLRLSDEFLQGPEPSFIKKSVGAGRVGMVGNFNVIRVPDTYFANTEDFGDGKWDDTDVQFLATYKKSVIRPFKIKNTRIRTDTDFLNGWLIQGHFYSDAFVLGKRSAGVYVYKKA